MPLEVVVRVEFCEKCQTYRFFIRSARDSNGNWICMGHSDYDLFQESEIKCGHKCKENEFEPKSMAH